MPASCSDRSSYRQRQDKKIVLHCVFKPTYIDDVAPSARGCQPESMRLWFEEGSRADPWLNAGTPRDEERCLRALPRAGL